MQGQFQWKGSQTVPDLRRTFQGTIRTASRAARHLPGTIGGLGVYFSAQDRLDAVGREHTWRRDVDELLARSDRALAAGRIDAALNWFDKALRISYHPALHNSGGSLLASDPRAFLAPLRRSRTGAVLFDEQIAPGSVPQRPAHRSRDAGDPLRVIVIAQRNWTFITPILDELRESGRYEILEVEVDDLPAGGIPDREQLLRGRFDLATTGQRLATPARIADGFDWADVALVEWGHHVLTWVTLLDRAPRRLVARYHRFETFTPFPLLHDHAQVDLTLHVSQPVANLLDAIVPAASATPTRYVANLLSRGLGAPPEGTPDIHRLVQIGWSHPIKDVMFTLEVIERLRRHDTRYRLQLVGPGLPVDARDATPYQQQVRRRIESLGPAGVDVLGVRQDVPVILSEAGFVLSSSYQEGTHEAVMEGLAAGCPAVIRDWPDFARYGGAATLYRDDWVVADVDSAVQRILELQDPQRYAEESRQAREWVVRKRDPEVVLTAYDEALADVSVDPPEGVPPGGDAPEAEETPGPASGPRTGQEQ